MPNAIEQGVTPCAMYNTLRNVIWSWTLPSDPIPHGVAGATISHPCDISIASRGENPDIRQSGDGGLTLPQPDGCGDFHQQHKRSAAYNTIRTPLYDAEYHRQSDAQICLRKRSPIFLIQIFSSLRFLTILSLGPPSTQTLTCLSSDTAVIQIQDEADRFKSEMSHSPALQCQSRAVLLRALPGQLVSLLQDFRCSSGEATIVD
jgi:hypothetical protein